MNSALSTQSSITILYTPPPSPATFLTRLERLLARPDPRVRLRAALKIGRHGARGTLKPVLRRLELECDPAVIAALLVALARVGNARHVVVVSPYLSHRDHRVIRAAALALYRLGKENALPLLIGLLGRDDERVVKAALVALLRTDAGTLFEHVAMLCRNPLAAPRAMGKACRELLRDAGVRERSGLTAEELEPRHAALDAALAARPSAPVRAPVVPPHPNRYHASGVRALVGIALVVAMALAIAGTGEGAARVDPVDPVARALDRTGQPARPADAAPLAASAAADPTDVFQRVDALRRAAAARRPRAYRLPIELIARRSAELVKSRGITNSQYIELKVRARLSEEDGLAAVARAHAADALGDVQLALAVLAAALEALHPGDLERRIDLLRQRRLVLERHGRRPEARRAALDEARAEAALAAILEATTDRTGRPLAPAGTARAAQARAQALARAQEVGTKGR